MGARKETTARPVNLKDSRNSPSRPAKAQAELAAFRDQLRRLYFGNTRVAQQFRCGLLVFYAVTIAFIVGSAPKPGMGYSVKTNGTWRAVVNSAAWDDWLGLQGEIKAGPA